VIKTVKEVRRNESVQQQRKQKNKLTVLQKK